MKRVMRIGFVGLLFILAACGGGAPAEPTVAPAPTEVATPTTEPAAGPTSTTGAMVEPTDTPEPTVIPEPSPTPAAEPTAKPTKEPPPEVSLETITGLFMQYDDQAGGNNWLLFNEDGAVVGRHGPTFETGTEVFQGTFALDGNVLTLILPEECPDGERYELRFATANQLHFDVLDTTCDAFADDFRRLPNWKRAEEE